MADTKKYYHNLDVDGNMVQNLLLNPLTTTQRLALTLGVSDESYTTFDTDLNTPYYWDGAAWIVGVGSSLPSQTGNAGKWLTTNGTTASWQTLGGNVSLFTNDAGYINLSSLSGGTGISYNNLTGVITNSAPDQTVVINSSTGISIAGGYPTFTITNSAPDQIVSLTGGTGISITGTYPNFTITGTAVGMSRSINSVSINTAAGATSGTDYIYLVTGITTITLPTAVGNTNLYTVKNVGNNTVSIATTGGETIDGSSTITLPVKYTSIDVISDGTNWNII